MKLRVRGLPILLAGGVLAWCVGQASPVLAAPSSTAAPVIKVGQRVQVVLAKDASANFVVGLPKGAFMVLCDTQADANSNVVQASVKLLKANGADLPDYPGALLSWYEFNSVWRAGKTITLKKPLSGRLRIKNSNLSSGTFWLTVLAAPPKQFHPFGFGATVTPAKIGANNGVGGTFAKGENRFYRATLPAGQWDISLGARPVEKAYVNAQLQIFDANGLPTNYRTASAESTNEEARCEVKVDLKQPTTLIIRARNVSNNGGTLEHDITISKAEG